MMLIQSRDNPLVRDYVRLSENRAHRTRTGRFVLEGARLAKDALCSGARIETAFFTAEAAQKYPDLLRECTQKSIRTVAVTPPVAEKLAGTKTPQGVFCTAFMLDKASFLDTINGNGLFLALENIQDPGNLGTMLRSAEAFGLDGVLLSPGCADLWSPKTVRAGMGASFRLNSSAVPDFTAALLALRGRGFPVLGAVADAGAPDVRAQDFSRGCAVVIGNEGNGLTPECRAACSGLVTIRMLGRAESLNAAAAAAVLMWEMTRGR